jgi:uncharacterized PurR-regulated membrane protein YhhQ (DUF165 family)
VPVAPGLVAPAGVYVVGLALVLRDLLRERAGLRATFAAIVAGSLLSAIIAPRLALASGVAFLLSETADALVYEPLRERGRTLARATSQVVGAAIDSAVFLWLAFGSLAYFPGQLTGKLVSGAAAIAFLARWNRRRASAA